jgi:hypothetical protein
VPDVTDTSTCAWCKCCSSQIEWPEVIAYRAEAGAPAD